MIKKLPQEMQEVIFIAVKAGHYFLSDRKTAETVVSILLKFLSGFFRIF